MFSEKIELGVKRADGFVFEFGPVNMVFAKTQGGMIGCGLINVMVFDNFSFPAALIKSASGPIKDLSGLLDGTVKEVNESASNKGVIVGMSGRKALEMM